MATPSISQETASVLFRWDWGLAVRGKFKEESRLQFPPLAAHADHEQKACNDVLTGPDVTHNNLNMRNFLQP